MKQIIRLVASALMLVNISYASEARLEGAPTAGAPAQSNSLICITLGESEVAVSSGRFRLLSIPSNMSVADFKKYLSEKTLDLGDEFDLDIFFGDEKLIDDGILPQSNIFHGYEKPKVDGIPLLRLEQITKTAPMA